MSLNGVPSLPQSSDSHEPAAACKAPVASSDHASGIVVSCYTVPHDGCDLLQTDLRAEQHFLFIPTVERWQRVNCAHALKIAVDAFHFRLFL